MVESADDAATFFPPAQAFTFTAVNTFKFGKHGIDLLDGKLDKGQLGRDISTTALSLGVGKYFEKSGMGKVGDVASIIYDKILGKVVNIIEKNSK